MVSFAIIPNPINFVNKSPLIFSFLFTLHKNSSLFLSTQPILSLHGRGDAVFLENFLKKVFQTFQKLSQKESFGV